MTFSHPKTVRDALITARRVLGKPTLSWSYDRRLERRASGTMMVPEGYTVIDPGDFGQLGNVKLHARFSYDAGRTWLNHPEDWYMLNWSFQTVEAWEAENQ